MTALDQFVETFFGVRPTNETVLDDHDRELAQRVSGMTLASVVIDVRELRDQKTLALAPMLDTATGDFEKQVIATYHQGFKNACDLVIAKLGGTP